MVHVNYLLLCMIFIIYYKLNIINQKCVHLRDVRFNLKIIIIIDYIIDEVRRI